MNAQPQEGSKAPTVEGARDVIFIVNSVPDKKGQVRYQRILALTSAFNVYVVTRAPLPAELSERAERVRVTASRRQMLREALSLARELAARKRKFYVHTQFLPFAGLVGLRCRQTTGCRWVADLWDHPSLKWAHIRGPLRWWRQSVWWAFRRLVLPRSDAWIVAMHPGILEHLPAVPDSCRLIYSRPGYIPEENVRETKSAVTGNGEIEIVYAGLIKSNRGFDLMAGWADSYVGAQKVRLHLVGRCSAETAPLLDRLVADTKSAQHVSVEVHGEVAHAEVMRILGQSHIGLCPINSEVLNYRYAYPVKVIEYFGSGMIVVATRAQGTGSLVVNNQTGFTFDYDLQSFSAAMEKAISACRDEKRYKEMSQKIDDLAAGCQWQFINRQLVQDILQALQADDFPER